ncbi:MAG TPA: hypothetical protein EYQ62_09220 [Verrucomicrobiales bacterium]|jgi:hypothetical protein|nr:hypothetical protein [Verrucomicrobiales bacterium]HIL24901.1 hypothetical protein [Verrucomicrobiota bacterium]
MDPLEPPALHYVKAAFGWIELGNVPEALAELARIPVELQSLPAVQAARLDCLVAAEHWDDAAALAGVLCEQHPEEAGLWLHFAYAMRRCEGGSIEQAHAVLAPRVEQFPADWLIPYNVACYLCQMNRLPEARELLELATAVGGDRVEELAKNDEDLAPLRGES